MSETNPRAVVGNNSGEVVAPVDVEGAMAEKMLDGQRLRQLIAAVNHALAGRKGASDRIKEVRNEAKNDNVIPRAMQFLVSRGYAADDARAMLEAYDTWVSLFYGREAATPMQPEADRLKEHVAAFVEATDERKEEARAVRQAYKDIAEAGFDVVAVRMLERMADMDQTERGELFTNLDQYATFLRYW